MRNLQKLALVAAMTGSMLTPVVSFAETLNDALRWAYVDNPDLNAARAGVKQAIESANATNSATLPQLNFSSNYGYSAQRPYQGDWIKGDTLSATVSASLLLYDGGQSGLATDAALANASATRYRVFATEQQVLLATVQAYVNVLQYRSLVSSSNNNIKALNSQAASARVAYDAGAATVTELAQTEAAVSQAKADLASTQAQLATAEATYQSLTGHAPGQLSAIQNLPELPASLAAAQQVAVQSSPLVMSALESERAAQYDLRRSQAAHMPSVNMSVGGTRSNALDNTGYSDGAQLGVGVNIPLYTGGRLQALERQAQAALEARASETSSARLQAQSNVAAAWAQLQTSNSAYTAMKQVVEAQSLADQGAQVEFEVGALTVTDRLITQQDLIAAKANLLSTQYQRQFAVYNVLFAMGQLTIDEMGLGVPKIEPLETPAPAKAKPASPEEKAVNQISDRWSKK